MGSGDATWCVLPVLTVGELAARLNLTPKDLAWFSDRRNLGAKDRTVALRHYHYRWIQKRNGTARLIESPKPRLKAIQRFLLREILEKIPPHEAAHGFRKNRSILTFTKSHVGRAVVIRLDLENFFTSLTRARVHAIFLTSGYPESVAEILASLCTHSTPPDVVRVCPTKLDVESVDKFRQWHLPQGAPTSPALANLCAFRLDCRLAGLAHSLKVNYTRYADDLVFSGDFEGGRAAERFHIAVCRIALEEGFRINTRKTRIMRRSVSQRAAGVVLNEKQNVSRKDYDNLKAVLHNCAKKGVASQTEEPVDLFLARLGGRIAHVEIIHPGRGAKLRAMFDDVRGSEPAR